jgi:hypothetical protein
MISRSCFLAATEGHEKNLLHLLCFPAVSNNLERNLRCDLKGNQKNEDP